MAKRANPGKTPENKTPEVPRDEKGRILPGFSGNPGGIPAKALEARRLALESMAKVMERAKEAIEQDDDREHLRWGADFIADRGLGRRGKGAELPDEVAPEIPTDTSPAAMLTLAKRGLARVLSHLERRAASGHPLSDSEVSILTEASRTLSTLANEEREQQKAGVAGSMTDAELREAVLAAMPTEAIEAALAARREAK